MFLAARAMTSSMISQGTKGLRSAPYRMKRQRAYGKIMLTLYEREAD